MTLQTTSVPWQLDQLRTLEDTETVDHCTSSQHCSLDEVQLLGYVEHAVYFVFSLPKLPLDP